MSWGTSKLGDLAFIKTGKLDSNVAVENGLYPFFTCDPRTLSINTWAYDTEAVLLAGNNASGNYTAKYYNGKFNAYQRTYIIESLDKVLLNVRFLSYAITQQLRLLKTMSSGSTTKFLTIGMLHNLEIPLPSIEIQKKIVDILSAYDALIENNRTQIKLLEEAAQRLYKEWFVDLCFPGHEDTAIVDSVPSGWKRVSLKDMIGYEIGGGWGSEVPTKDCDFPAYVIRGTDLFGLAHGDLTEIPYRFHEKSNLKSRQLMDGDIIFEVSGGSKTEGVARTALIRQRLLDTFRSPVICASFCKLIRVENKEHAQYLYDTLQHLRRSGKTVEFDKRSASSIVNYRWKDFLQQQAILIPEQSILIHYNKLAEEIYQKILVCSIQIMQIKTARDNILPKLISGELEV